MPESAERGNRESPAAWADPVSCAAVEISSHPGAWSIVAIAREHPNAVRLTTIRGNIDVVELDELRGYLAREVQAAGRPDPAWQELLYDLGAHDDPLRHLGETLCYVSIARRDDQVTVKLTDGSTRGTYVESLTQAEPFGLPDDLATAFIERDTGILAFDSTTEVQSDVHMRR